MLHDGSIAWVNLDRAKEIVDTILDVYSKRFNKEIFMFELTGGEPTVYPHIDEFSKFLKQRGIIVSLCTNGSRSLRWWDEFGGNFTSITNSYHPEFTDVEHLTKVCNLLRSKKVNAHSLVLLDPNNFDKVKKDIEYMRTNGTFGVFVRKVYKRNEGTMETREYTPEQLDYLVKNSRIVSKVDVKIPPELVYRTFWIKEDNSLEETNENFIIGTPKNNFKDWNCYGGIDTLSLDMKGYIFSAYCSTGTSNSIGNWRTDTIKDIKWPEKPMICNSKCACVHDVKSRKIK
jgi:organic radical activating enzyme